jgi:uncharacterized membrane protein YbhN (UPF0104 family)
LKKIIGNILKIGIPLVFGVWVIWYQYNQLEADQVNTIKQSFRDANYLFVLLSVLFGTFSHLSRAYRWRYTLAPLGIKIGFANSFFSVMVAYVANIVFPRMGEVSRCAIITKYENQPFEKLFGTVVAERVADIIILLSIIAVVLVLQIDILRSTLDDLMAQGGDPQAIVQKLALLGVIGIFIGVGALIFIRRSSHPLAMKLKNLLSGLLDGVVSILKMEKKWEFLVHTAFIWVMYLAMFWIVFYALPETSEVSAAGILASFVVGGLSIVLVQGGIGAYPWGVSLVLLAYGVTETAGVTLGWIIWTAQTIMILFWGAISLIALPMVNSKANAN